MSYLSPADLIAQFGDSEIAEAAWPDDTGTRADGLLLSRVIDEETPGDDYTAEQIAAATAAAARISDVVADASAEIDSYKSNSFEPSEYPSDPYLRVLALDVTRYRLYDDGVTDIVRERYEKAEQALADLRDGKRTLPSSEVAAVPESDDPQIIPGNVRFSGAARVFTRESWSGF